MSGKSLALPSLQCAPSREPKAAISCPLLSAVHAERAQCPEPLHTWLGPIQTILVDLCWTPQWLSGNLLAWDIWNRTHCSRYGSTSATQTGIITSINLLAIPVLQISHAYFRVSWLSGSPASSLPGFLSERHFQCFEKEDALYLHPAFGLLWIFFFLQPDL